MTVFDEIGFPASILNQPGALARHSVDRRRRPRPAWRPHRRRRGTVAMTQLETAALRIVDASLNRAAEGLRVSDDYVRFVLDDAHLTEQLKLLRHDLAAVAAHWSPAERHSARDVEHDVGSQITTPSEGAREDAAAVCQTNFERSKQALRSLEEYCKTVSADLGAQLERLRLRLYAVEAAVGRTVDALDRLRGVRLCVLVHGGRSEDAFEAIVRQCLDAGVGMIQLRAKDLDDRTLIARGRRLTTLCRERALQRHAGSPSGEAGGPLAIINDRTDVARAVDADGVHLGQEDLEAEDARKILGPRKLIGVSTHSLEQARRAVFSGANYLGAGPVFPSKTKDFDVFAGLQYLREATAEVRLPLFAIGGIGIENLQQVMDAGADRIAVSSAVVGAPDPCQAAGELLGRLHADSSGSPC